MRIVAPGVYYPDPDTLAGETTHRRIDSHEALAPAEQPLSGKVRINFRERSQLDGVDTGAQAGPGYEAIPMVGRRPDEQRTDRLRGAAEESDTRVSAFVRECLSRQLACVNDNRRPGERLIALSDHANGNVSRNGAQRQQRPDRRDVRGYR